MVLILDLFKIGLLPQISTFVLITNRLIVKLLGSATGGTVNCWDLMVPYRAVLGGVRKLVLTLATGLKFRACVLVGIRSLKMICFNHLGIHHRIVRAAEVSYILRIPILRR